MSFVRTVLGDVDASGLGITLAHEHIIIAGGEPVEVYPDICLADVGKAVEELEPVHALRLRSVIDAMLADRGCDAVMLADVTRRSGVRTVASTGLHTARYYDARVRHRLLLEDRSGPKSECARWFDGGD